MDWRTCLKAYLAGVAVPSVVVVAALGGYCEARLAGGMEYPVERVLVFPLALLPAIWGC